MSGQHYDVIIIGAGPAGIFSALELVSAKSDLRILIVEKGRDIDRRSCPSKEKGINCINCSPCSILSGWGGAGAFSDGKITLSTEVGGMLGNYIGELNLKKHIDYVDSLYVQYGGPEKVYGVDEEDAIRDIRQKAAFAPWDRQVSANPYTDERSSGFSRSGNSYWYGYF